MLSVAAHEQLNLLLAGLYLRLVLDLLFFFHFDGFLIIVLIAVLFLGQLLVHLLNILFLEKLIDTEHGRDDHGVQINLLLSAF